MTTHPARTARETDWNREGRRPDGETHEQQAARVRAAVLRIAGEHPGACSWSRTEGRV